MLPFQRTQMPSQEVNAASPIQTAAHPALGNIATDIFRCPLHPHAGPLQLVGWPANPEDDNACPQEWVCGQCGRSYPFVDGILDLLAREKQPDVLREREIKQWDEQAAQYEATRRDDALYQAMVRGTARALQLRPGELILDAGCGTGMIVRRYFQPGLRLICLDFSRDSLRRLRETLPIWAACCVRADLTALPLADGVFDRVLCANALQHLPNPAERGAAFAELCRVVRPGGRVVVSVHNYSVPKRRAGWLKEGPGMGNSGPVQYLYRYDVEEFRNLLATRLQVERVCGIGLPLPYGLKLSWLSRGLERLLSRFGVSAPWGNLLLGIARRPGAAA
jgi:SAM-dependent methyltransferase